jgi:hypothetical protein
MSYLDELTLAVRRERATKQGLLARCARLPISFGMDAANIATMSAAEFARAILLKLGHDSVANPVLALSSWLDGAASGGRMPELQGVHKGAGMDSSGASFMDKYLAE